MASIFEEMLSVYQAARAAGVPQEHVVLSLSSTGLVRLMDESELTADWTEFLNSIQVTCTGNQKEDVALGLPPGRLFA